MKNAGPFGPGVVVSARGRQSPSRGEQLTVRRPATWEELQVGHPQRSEYAIPPGKRQSEGPHASHASRCGVIARACGRPSNLRAPGAIAASLPEVLRILDGPHARAMTSEYASETPALRLGDQEVAEHLDARHRFQLFRIDEIRLEGEAVDVAEQLHQAAVLLDQIIGKHGDAEPALAGAAQAEHVVDHEPGLAGLLAVAGDLGEPVHVLEIVRRVAAEHHDAMTIEIL